MNGVPRRRPHEMYKTRIYNLYNGFAPGVVVARTVAGYLAAADGAALAVRAGPTALVLRSTAGADLADAPAAVRIRKHL